MIQRLDKFLSHYSVILRPWFCVAAYLWGLELQSAYRASPEPLLDQSANASAILWTMLFWTLLFSAALTLAGLPWPRIKMARANEFICRVAVLLISGYYLRHWLDGWRSERPEHDFASWPLLIAVAFAYWLVRRRRLRSSTAANSRLPSWQDGFSFCVVPLLLATAIILAIKIAGHGSGQKIVEAAPRAESSAGHKAAAAAPNIVVIVADAMRARSMSLYGYPEKTTPFLERLAESSNVYLNMHSNGTTTVISLLSILTGKHPLTIGRPVPQIPSQPDREHLLGVLRANGYATAAVTSNVDAGFKSLGLSAELTAGEQTAFSFLTLSWLRDLGVYPTALGEQMYADLSLILPFLGYPRRTSYHGESEDTSSLAKQTISRLRQPFFLFVHFHQPHDPYTPPTLRAWFKRLVAQFGATGKSELKLYAPYPPASQPIADNYKRQYEASIQRVDAVLGDFAGWLQAQSWFSNSLFIVTADHGESFERGFLNRNLDLYENVTSVPLLIRFPGQKNARRSERLVQSIDIAPTVLRALNLAVPAWMEGRPLVAGSQPAEGATVAVSYKRRENDAEDSLPAKLAVWRNRYKLIASCETGKSVLYDLAIDPEERNDLTAQQPALADDLKRQLKSQLSGQSQEPRSDCPNL